ncbi:MAG: hypothetical protein WBH19_05745 [Candidatus Nanopelagicales bacterium]|nr:hypothetical protein [Actinomycetota bacterium]MBT5500920.1 hypothetical protein [Actinomycetota bacterium]MBT5806746.1 hypothetical protein [Actinomycetota bacterium]MDA9333955.1 hypothetical protein [Actinomycetota bacterium]
MATYLVLGPEPLESFDVPQLESKKEAAISTTTIPLRLRLRTIPPSNPCTRQSQVRHAYEIVGGHTPDKMLAAANVVQPVHDSPY